MGRFISAKHFTSDKDIDIISGTETPTNQSNMPNGDVIPDGSLYVCTSGTPLRESIYQLKDGLWVRVADSIDVVTSNYSIAELVDLFSIYGYNTVTGTSIPLGGIAKGTTFLATKLVKDVVYDLLNPPVAPSITLSVNQATVVEVGTTISGSKTFTYVITPETGVITLLQFIDVTAANSVLSSIAAPVPLSGIPSIAVTSNQLNSDGATQVWQSKLTNTNGLPNPNFPSANYSVVARYSRFWGARSGSPPLVDQTDINITVNTVRALPNNAVQTSGNVFNLVTGTTLLKFCVILPPSVTIVSVLDSGNLNQDITSSYVSLGIIKVIDAGGTSRDYNRYEMNVGSAYPVSTTHVITTN